MVSAFVDVSTTSYGYGKGIVHEANPILKPIVDHSNIFTAMAVKGSLHVGVSWLILDKYKDHPKLAVISTIGLMTAQTYVDYRNIKTINAHPTQ